MNRTLFKKALMATVAVGLCAYTQTQAQNTPKPPKMEPEMTEFWEPEVRVVTPGVGTAAPADAIVLFDGKNLSQWKAKSEGSEAKWPVKDNAFTVGKGDISTKKDFQDFQLHIEWSAPDEVKGESQGRGNSGIFLQDRYEVQVLDSYNNRTYANGQAGSIYKQHRPLVNVTRKPTEWNVYDIIYTAPRFKEDGSVFTPARVTVLHNGVLVQNNVEVKGPTEYIGLPEYKQHGKAPITLQDHGNPVQYRNIWIREL
ncbi:3-keto-disaccharide hydrolase [Pontibacter chitinilyticus]|uniref:3-keto-disaccharide hydrolase n=1 Tax=Pontibacter chitinilyticus TaxID=2674989 RepID=UPI003218E552